MKIWRWNEIFGSFRKLQEKFENLNFWMFLGVFWTCQGDKDPLGHAVLQIWDCQSFYFGENKPCSNFGLMAKTVSSYCGGSHMSWHACLVSTLDQPVKFHSCQLLCAHKSVCGQVPAAMIKWFQSRRQMCSTCGWKYSPPQWTQCLCLSLLTLLCVTVIPFACCIRPFWFCCHFPKRRCHDRDTHAITSGM